MGRDQQAEGFTLLELLELPRVHSELAHWALYRGEISLGDISFELKKKTKRGELLE